MINVTDNASEKLRALLEEKGQPHAALRVIVVPNSQGAQYMLALEENQAEDDLVLHDHDVRVIADIDSAPLLEGAEIDYTAGLMRSGFVINNPNLTATGHGCACGGSGCGCGAH